MDGKGRGRDLCSSDFLLGKALLGYYRQVKLTDIAPKFPITIDRSWFCYLRQTWQSDKHWTNISNLRPFDDEVQENDKSIKASKMQ